MRSEEFDAFAREQLPRLLRYAVMLTGDRDLAQDLVQDVMVKVHRRWPLVAASDRPDRYVTTMVTNAYLSWRRTWAVRHLVLVDAVPEAAVTNDDGPDREEIWQRLAGLPRRQRAALVLRFYEDLTDTEIAAAMGCSASTARVHIHRALKTLRLELTQPNPTVSTSWEHK